MRRAMLLLLLCCVFLLSACDSTGGVTPQPSPDATEEALATPTEAPTPSPTPTASPTPTVSPSPTPTPAPTPTPTPEGYFDGSVFGMEAPLGWSKLPADAQQYLTILPVVDGAKVEDIVAYLNGNDIFVGVGIVLDEGITTERYIDTMLDGLRLLGAAEPVETLYGENPAMLSEHKLDAIGISMSYKVAYMQRGHMLAVFQYIAMDPKGEPTALRDALSTVSFREVTE